MRSARSSDRTVLVVGGYADSLWRFRGPFLKALRERGYRVVAAAPSAGGDAASLERATSSAVLVGVERRLADIGVDFFQLPALPRRTLRIGVHEVRFARDLWRIVGELRPRLVVSYGLKALVISTLVALLRRVPTRAVLLAGLGATAGRKQCGISAVNHVLRPVLGAATHAIVQNPDDLRSVQEMASTAKPTLCVSGSGVKLADYVVVPPPRDPVFVFVGRLMRSKGIFEFCEAAASVRSSAPSTRFVVLGVPDDDSSVTTTNIRRWRRSGIEFEGWVGDVRPYLNAATALVLPSYYPEGQPRSVLEAKASARAVITTDSRGCRETVDDGYDGFLVPPRDAARLAEKILELAADRALAHRMGLRARIRAERDYDADVIGGIMADFLTGEAGEGDLRD